MDANGARPVIGPRPLWLTAILVAVGIVGGPLALLGLAVGAESVGLEDSSAVGAAFAVYVAIGVLVVAVRAVRPLGVGMLVGSLAVILMFLATGGTS